MNGMDIVGSCWFTLSNGSLIGIVIGRDKITREEKSYIGLGHGINQAADELLILDRGSHFPLEAAKILI